MSNSHQPAGIPWATWRAQFAALEPAAPRALDPAAWPDLEAWRKTLRARALDLLCGHHDAPGLRDAPVRTLGEVACDGYRRRTLLYRTAPGIETEAWLLLPEGATPAAPRPGVLALHDWGGLVLFGRAKILEVPGAPEILRAHWAKCYEGRPFAGELARRGFAVLVGDAFGFGDRRLHDASTVELEASGRPFDEIAAELNDLHSRVRGAVADNLLLAAGRTSPGTLVSDDVRALDVLAAQPEVDAKRLACMGLSMGGWRAVHLAALDERIACVVPVGWMSTLLPIVLRRPVGSLGSASVIHGLVRDADFPHLAALAAPRPMLSIQGREDKHFPPAATEAAWRQIGEVYRRLGRAEAFRASMYEAPHRFDLAMQNEAFTWLERWLGPVA
ncbi:MAG: dienelactone hydrolase family protein [Planctomycetota bacterium]|nr:dienelactone hydrolase family protein [Planctomycetota bacterium]